ncbi:MAG: hypothetical protein J0H55_02915 [Chitinophagaceae bacterium]|nr:hypothetical protein [Chitinophagaceae bacterium]
MSFDNGYSDVVSGFNSFHYTAGTKYFPDGKSEWGYLNKWPVPQRWPLNGGFGEVKDGVSASKVHLTRSDGHVIYDNKLRVAISMKS